MLTVYGIETTSSKVDIARKIVATVLTVYGIETLNRIYGTLWSHRLQQYLPFTVLKRWYLIHTYHEFRELQQYLPFTVLKHQLITDSDMLRFKSLQQYLPFTVLKLRSKIYFYLCIEWLQQYLPLAVFNRILRLKPRVDY